MDGEAGFWLGFWLVMKLVYVVGASGFGVAVSLALGHAWTWKHMAMPFSSLLGAERAHRMAVVMASWGCVPKDRTVDPSILVSRGI